MNTTGGRLLISIRAANASSVTHAGGAMCGSSMLSSFVVSQRTEARKHEAPAAAGRGLRDLIADWLNASAYPTAPPKGDAHVHGYGGRGANCPWWVHVAFCSPCQ